MQPPFGFRTLLAICSALAILLGALAAVQYRWSTRVAAADAQREREHLDAAASLFANEFNGAVMTALEFMQKDAATALKSGQRLTSLPRLIGDLYYLDARAENPPRVEKLSLDGTFAPSAAPEWLQSSRCVPILLEHPPALVSEILDIRHFEERAGGLRIYQAFQRGRQCFVGTLNQQYLRDELFPKLIHQSFGGTSSRDYEFAIVPRSHSSAPIYGAPLRADLEKPFFTMAPFRLAPPRDQMERPGAGGKNMLYVQRFETTVVTGAAPARYALGDGIWELQVQHKGIPLAVAFERTRRRDLLLSLGVEALLVAAILFLVTAVRRMQKLAEQKMQFVAAVSHELRAPVSALSMLSRNQADGLVTGTDKVQQYGELMHQQSRRLNEMVEQTLQYAGIHSGLPRPAKTEVDLRRLIQEAVDARHKEWERNQIEVEVAVSPNLPPITGDWNLLRIAFDNLLSNAEKYAASGRWIRTSATYAADQNEVLISVEDRGPGISATDQVEIFEPFCRGRAAIDAQIPGSGIGLSLVRSAAEAHHGSVTVASEPGRGATFTMHLPV